jgi:hypothetical protein
MMIDAILLLIVPTMVALALTLDIAAVVGWMRGPHRPERYLPG